MKQQNLTSFDRLASGVIRTIRRPSLSPQERDGCCYQLDKVASENFSFFLKGGEWLELYFYAKLLSLERTLALLRDVEEKGESFEFGFFDCFFSGNNLAAYEYLSKIDCKRFGNLSVFKPRKRPFSLPRLVLLWYFVAWRVQSTAANETSPIADVFYVTLPAQVDRQKRLEDCLKYFGLTFERHYGIDARALPDSVFSHLQRLGYMKHADRRKGTLGCIASHVAAIERWLATSSRNWLLVLEDDATLFGYPAEMVEHVLTEKAREPCIIVCNHRRYLREPTQIPHIDLLGARLGWHLYALRNYRFGGGTDGYFLNRAAAQFVVAYFSSWGLDCGYDVFQSALAAITTASFPDATPFQKLINRYSKHLLSRYSSEDLPRTYLLGLPLCHDLFGLATGSTR